MKLGKIQQDIIKYLSRCNNNYGVICSITEAEEFRGYDLDQVEKSLDRLIARNIVQRVRIGYKLINAKND